MMSKEQLFSAMLRLGSAIALGYTSACAPGKQAIIPCGTRGEVVENASHQVIFDALITDSTKDPGKVEYPIDIAARRLNARCVPQTTKDASGNTVFVTNPDNGNVKYIYQVDLQSECTIEAGTPFRLSTTTAHGERVFNYEDVTSANCSGNVQVR